MAKIYGLFGSMTGKLADTVMSVRNGEQIARKYQPVVYNPSTPAQIATRAKLKLMSQLSAVLAPFIAIPRVGPVSSRNLFTKVNFGSATYNNNEADVDIVSIQLTKSSVGLPPLSVRKETNETYVGLQPTVTPASVDRMVYVLLQRGTDNRLRVVGSAVAESAGDNGRWEAIINVDPAETFILGYGIRLNNDAARAKYGNLEAPTAQDIARIVVSKTLLESDITLTETRGVIMAAPSN